MKINASFKCKIVTVNRFITSFAIHSSETMHQSAMTDPLIFSEDDVENGGKEAGIQNDFAFNNNVLNASIKIRMGILISHNSDLI